MLGREDGWQVLDICGVNDGMIAVIVVVVS